jgi:hypothetical protein
LTTTRIGGGRKAWLVALGALVVLGSVIYLGASGKSVPLATPPKPTQPAVAEITARPAVPTGTPLDLTQVTSIRADPTAPVRYQYLGTGLTINGRGTLAILDPVGPDQYRGIYRIPYALKAPTAHLEFDAVSASVSHDDLETIGTWDFPINSISGPGGPPTVVLDTGGQPQEGTVTNPDFTRLATNGFRLNVTTTNEADAAFMTIDIVVNPEQVAPPTIEARPTR